MGLDQHRAHITAEWLDTDSGEISRRRVSPADRVGVRSFVARFAGHDLDVALEATTGWRFVVDELPAIGAGVHLAPFYTLILSRFAHRFSVGRARDRIRMPANHFSG